MRTNKPWTEEEKDKLREMWGSNNTRKIAQKLDRSRGSIYNMIRRMNLQGKGNSRGSGKHWTEEEEQFLKDNWFNMSSYEIAEEIDRTPNAITSKVERMNFAPKPTDYMYEDWTKDEEIYLLNHYCIKKDKEIANELGKTLPSLKSKKRSMGISTSWDMWEDEVLYDFYWCDCMTIEELSQTVLSHRNYHSIKHRVHRLGIKAYPKGDETITCLNCGKKVKVKHYALDKRRFCSTQCFLKYQGPTSIEEKMMDELDKSGYEYKFQEEIGKYLVDFLLEDMNLIIETDGDFWHDGINEKRENFLLGEGYNVIHFTGTEVNNNVEGCLTDTLIHFGGVYNF